MLEGLASLQNPEFDQAKQRIYEMCPLYQGGEFKKELGGGML